MRCVKLSLFAAAGLVAAASPASAANYNLSLTGDTTQVVPGTFPGGTQAALTLAGFDASNPLSVSLYDTVNVSVTLSSLFTVPVSTGPSLVDDLFSGTGFDGSNVHVTDTFSFYNAGTLVATYTGDAGTSLQLASGIAFSTGQSLTFDSYTDDFTIDALNGTATLTGGKLTYDVFNAVPAPEPATWMLTIAGMGMVGGAMRRRGRAARMVAA